MIQRKDYTRFFIIISLTICCSFLCVHHVLAQKQKVNFAPIWVPQSQFAGYYVAKEKGYFDEEGLDVVIKHISPDSHQSNFDLLYKGDIQITTSNIVAAIKEVASGKRIVNVLQTSQNGALMCVSNSPLPSFPSLNGKNVGAWKSKGTSDVALMAVADNHMQVNWIPFLRNVDLFSKNALDATLCYSYNEYIQLIMARGPIPKQNILRFSDIGYNYPEDGIYVTEEYYNQHKDIVDKFVAAVKKGWKFARSNEDETLEIVEKYIRDNNVITNHYHQKMMLREVLRLMVDKHGKVSYAKISPSLFDEIVIKLRNIGHIPHKIKYEDMIR